MPPPELSITISRRCWDLPGGRQAAEVVEERQVAEHRPGAGSAPRRQPGRGGDQPIDPVRAAVGGEPDPLGPRPKEQPPGRAPACSRPQERVAVAQGTTDSDPDAGLAELVELPEPRIDGLADVLLGLQPCRCEWRAGHRARPRAQRATAAPSATARSRSGRRAGSCPPYGRARATHRPGRRRSARVARSRRATGAMACWSAGRRRGRSARARAAAGARVRCDRRTRRRSERSCGPRRSWEVGSARIG